MPEWAEGEAHGALGVVNAIGTGGFGAAVALSLPLRVRVRRCKGYLGSSRVPGGVVNVNPVILRAVDEAAAEWLGSRPLGGLCAEAWTGIPYEAGLKGSSALVNALLEAVLRLRGVEPPGLPGLARLGVTAARKAGLTVTGALDDHAAVSGCGGYATDNRRQEILCTWKGWEGYAGIAVPGRRSIRTVSREAFTRLGRAYESAWRLLENGDWWGAAVLNGAATAAATGGGADTVLQALGLPGVVAAGVSGKGPAVYAVASTRREAEEAARWLAERTGASMFLVAELLPCRG